MTRIYKPMRAVPAPMPFSSDAWIFEIKWDGFRAIAYVNEKISLLSRTGKELKNVFPELGELKQLASNVVVDGEIVVVKNGKNDFQALLERTQAKSLLEIDLLAKRSPVVYVIFDILEKDNAPLVNLPLTERKKILKASIKEGNHVLLSDFVDEKGEAYYELVLKKGLEGIVAKKKGSLYEQDARSGSWLKIKKLGTCDCLILGYTRGSGIRSETFGALLLGLYNDKELIYMGKVGTGFSKAMLRTISDKFKQLKTNAAPISLDISDEVTWLKPEIICEVSYQAITKDGRLRMPRFNRLRHDKLPSECTLDQINQSELKDYRLKRDFNITPEPLGGGKNGESSIFVVQEHHARRLHFDFRLEKNGVLKSWAMPKGIPASSDEKRLAVQTEDHPLDYANFEGEIQKGQYGAGSVKIWDKGTYELKIWNEKMVEVNLKGEKLEGRYILVRLKNSGEKNWLFLKGKD